MCYRKFRHGGELDISALLVFGFAVYLIKQLHTFSSCSTLPGTFPLELLEMLWNYYASAYVFIFKNRIFSVYLAPADSIVNCSPEVWWSW